MIKSVGFTVVYYNANDLGEQYQMNSGVITLLNFGGTFFPSSNDYELAVLPYNASYETGINFFFGVAKIACRGGSYINLLAVENLNYNRNNNLQNLQLTLQT